MTEDTTITVKTESTDDVVEREAQNTFIGVKMQVDRERINERVQARLRELLDAAGIPKPTEEDTLKRLEQSVYDQMCAQRLNFLAEQAAKAKFFSKYPELKKGDEK